MVDGLAAALRQSSGCRCSGGARPRPQGRGCRRSRRGAAPADRRHAAAMRRWTRATETRSPCSTRPSLRRIFDAGRGWTDVHDLGAKADIGALPYEVVQGGLQVGPAEQDIATERLGQHRGTFAAQESSRRCVEVDLFERSGACLASVQDPHPTYHLNAIAFQPALKRAPC